MFAYLLSPVRFRDGVYGLTLTNWLGSIVENRPNKSLVYIMAAGSYVLYIWLMFSQYKQLARNISPLQRTVTVCYVMTNHLVMTNNNKMKERPSSFYGARYDDSIALEACSSPAVSDRFPCRVQRPLSYACRMQRNAVSQPVMSRWMVQDYPVIAWRDWTLTPRNGSFVEKNDRIKQLIIPSYCRSVHFSCWYRKTCQK